MLLVCLVIVVQLVLQQYACVCSAHDMIALSPFASVQVLDSAGTPPCQRTSAVHHRAFWRQSRVAPVPRCDPHRPVHSYPRSVQNRAQMVGRAGGTLLRCIEYKKIAAQHLTKSSACVVLNMECLMGRRYAANFQAANFLELFIAGEKAFAKSDDTCNIFRHMDV